MLVYTNIQHGYRKRHKLSCNEYVLCDCIFFLSNNADSKVPGWCYASRERLAEYLDFSKQGLLNMIDLLIADGYLIKNEQTKYLQTTPKWQAVYFEEGGKESVPGVQKAAVYNLTGGKQSVPPPGKQSVPEGGKQSVPYNNTIDNNSLDNTPSPHFAGLHGLTTWPFSTKPFKKLTPKDFREQVDFFIKQGAPREILDKFFAVWSEPDGEGRMRFQLKDTWHLPTRIDKFIKTEHPKTPSNAHQPIPASAPGRKPGTSEARNEALRHW